MPLRNMGELEGGHTKLWKRSSCRISAAESHLGQARVQVTIIDLHLFRQFVNGHTVFSQYLAYSIYV